MRGESPPERKNCHQSWATTTTLEAVTWTRPVWPYWTTFNHSWPQSCLQKWPKTVRLFGPFRKHDFWNNNFWTYFLDNFLKIWSNFQSLITLNTASNPGKFHRLDLVYCWVGRNWKKILTILHRFLSRCHSLGFMIPLLKWAIPGLSSFFSL